MFIQISWNLDWIVQKLLISAENLKKERKEKIEVRESQLKPILHGF